jgi:hypothetical protein
MCGCTTAVTPQPARLDSTVVSFVLVAWALVEDPNLCVSPFLSLSVCLYRTKHHFMYSYPHSFLGFGIKEINDDR